MSTKKDVMENKGIADAIEAAGSRAKLASALGVGVDNIGVWLRCIKPVPEKRCKQMQRLYRQKVKLTDLRDDAHEIWDIRRPKKEAAKSED